MRFLTLTTHRSPLTTHHSTFTLTTETHLHPRPKQVDKCAALQIACTDEQIFMQVKDSCCPRPFSPPPPSADLGICSSDDARGTERLAFKRPDVAK